MSGSSSSSEEETESESEAYGKWGEHDGHSAWAKSEHCLQ